MTKTSTGPAPALQVEHLQPFVSDDRAVSRTILLIKRLVPTNPPRRGTVEHADMRTSVHDARIALCLAMGRTVDEIHPCTGHDLAAG